MYSVSFEKECGCVKKDASLTAMAKSFETKDAAELEALRISNHMNKNYCKKHRFHVNEVGNTFVVDFDYSCKEGGGQ